MKNDDLILGKTIKYIVYDESGDSDKIILFFEDRTSAIIMSNASNVMYSLFIEKNK